ncbi:MAG: hypothetical protein DMG44_06735 [Acidobacteria bacterium]|nr:MAG: hypothetical protein DMG44_06735 [Acidobacteriota bacterium]
MRRTWIALLLSALVTVTASRATDGPDKEAAAKEAPAQTAAKKRPATAAKKPAEKSVTDALSAEVEQLRQMMARQSQQMEAQQKMMREQQEKLNALTEELRSAQAAASSAAAAAQEAKAEQGNAKVTEGQLEAVADATSDLTKKVAALDKDYQGEKKSLDGRIKAIGPFSFSGDMRVRDEPFIGGPCTATNCDSQVRNRMRFRLRFNINAKFNDDISGGFSLASGDLNDPISTNQTDIQFYARKPIAIDRAFVTYTPHQFKPLVFTGGKIAYPFYRTELVWDNDLNPEGVAQTLQWNFHDSTPVIRRFAVVGFALPFTELQHTTGVNRSRVESEVYGGQVQAVWQLGSWLRLSTYGAFYNYHNPDPIAFATAVAGGNPQTPLNGLLPLAGASVQNSITTTTVTNIVTDVDTDLVTGLPVTTTTATGVKTITNAQFASKFGLLDAIARFDIKTPYARLPLVVLGDYVQNTRACANVGNLPALGTTTTAATITTVTRAGGACFSRERRGYWLEGRIGRQSEAKDIQFAYTRMFIEREAVMGAFNFSDLRQNSNVSQHRVEVFYQAYKNVQLAFTGLIGRPLNWHVAAGTPPEPWLKRLQFDVIYKF